MAEAMANPMHSTKATVIFSEQPSNITLDLHNGIGLWGMTLAQIISVSATCRIHTIPHIPVRNQILTWDNIGIRVESHTITMVRLFIGIIYCVKEEAEQMTTAILIM